MTAAPQQQDPLSIIHILGYFYIKVKYIFKNSSTTGDELATDFVKNHLSFLRRFCCTDVAFHCPATLLLEIIHQ